MMCRRFLLTATVLITLSIMSFSAFAQDVTVPMPGEYVAPDTAPPPEQIPDPAAMLEDDGSSFAIPIPGGGEVQVQGPASEASTTRSPIENWATQRNNPSSVGTGPLGPVPSQQ
jgi:hypothetical protein